MRVGDAPAIGGLAKVPPVATARLIKAIAMRLVEHGGEDEIGAPLRRIGPGQFEIEIDHDVLHQIVKRVHARFADLLDPVTTRHVAKAVLEIEIRVLDEGFRPAIPIERVGALVVGVDQPGQLANLLMLVRERQCIVHPGYPFFMGLAPRIAARPRSLYTP